MRFLSILKSGASVKNVALEFVQVLLEKSWRENELCLEVACDFINDLLMAIGLEVVIIPEQIDAGGSYVWPVEQIQIYNFHYIEMDFKKVEEFLRKICYFVELENTTFVKDHKEAFGEDFESPVEYLMELVAVWCSVYKQLINLEELHANKRFEEPLARINFHLLLGIHELRKMYRLDLNLLDAICNRLYWSAVRGLYYKQTHSMIFSGLLEIFCQDYDLFYDASPRTMNFFYEAFAVEINEPTPLKLYQALQNILVEGDTTTNKLNILLNFLVEPHMLEVYFTTFMKKKCKWYNKITSKNIKNIQKEAITFLNILQSKLITLDCFSREFMEAILNLVFNSDHIISNLACSLYISMMRRKVSDHMILKHIMDFYAAHVGSIVYLEIYVRALYSSFECLLNVNNILEIVTDDQTTEIIRLLSAHILVIVFTLKVQEKDFVTKNEIQHLLQILPDIFENLHCQKTEGILLQVYSLLPTKKFKKPLLDNFIHYAVGIFTYTESPLEYPLLMNIFNVFHKCLMFNKEWQHLELLSDHILNKYQTMVKSLKQLEENSQVLFSQKSLEFYNGLIKRFNIILKTTYDLLDINFLEIIRNLSQYVLYNLETQSLIKENKSLIDVYVLEIIMSCILKLRKQQNDNNQDYTFLQEAKNLFTFLWSMLKNLDELLKFPTVRIKAYFCCFLQLIIYLPFKLDTPAYHQLVQILIAVNFNKNKSLNLKGANELQQLHPLQSLEYQRFMLRIFTQMHKCQKVQITTKTVWKLCIYYGMFKHNFQEELKNLLLTLANYRLEIYKHIISVLICSLYNQTPALKHITILSILKQHKHLIDNDVKVESLPLFKIHVVLMVLQILEKSLSVKRIKLGHNRLEALSHLHIFIEDLDLNQLEAKPLIQEQINQLRQNLIVAEESKILTDFQKQLN